MKRFLVDLAASIVIVPFVVIAVIATGVLVWQGLEPVSTPTGQQHGPNAKCQQWCAPKGHEGEAKPPDGIPVVTCKGTGDHSCTKLGEQCGKEHRPGCTESCRAHCCSCCSI